MSAIAIEELPVEWGAEVATPRIVPAHIFKSPICGCGRAKKWGPFCSFCWAKAPVDLRDDVWKREDLPLQLAALTELQRILGHTHEPVKPDTVRIYRPTIEVEVPAMADPEPTPIVPQAPPEETPRYIVRLTENQMDKFLVSASAEWKQRMVQSLLDAEDE